MCVTPVDSQVIRGIAELYEDSDTRHITVRSVDIDRDQAIFTWTNDSLPRSSECPKEYINDLLHVNMALISRYYFEYVLKSTSN